MNLTVLGAAGATGVPLVEQAIAAGHHVTALARSAENLTLTSPNLHVPEGGDTTAGAGPMGKSKRQSGNWPRVAGEGETGRSPRSGPDS